MALLKVVLPALVVMAGIKLAGDYTYRGLQYEIVKDKNGQPDSISLFMYKGHDEEIKKTFVLDEKAVKKYNEIIGQSKKFDQIGVNDTEYVSGWNRYSGMGSRIKSITPHSVRYLKEELQEFAKSQIPDSAVTKEDDWRWNGERGK